ncbi:MAG: 4Fe-4S dicluster domain-containing protein [Desulfobacterales bacterium]|nr:4Fe-4S dicluster domain-containing protein [Desulfobacterales bacterium]
MYQEIAIKTYIHTNFDKCTGCSICQLACSFDLFKGYNPRLARLTIKSKKENLYHLPVVCNQCENAYCMNVCPVKAINRSDEGIVAIDPDKCIGCGLCAQYCPIEMIFINPETKKAYKCELCQGEPLCVEACPTGALELVHGEVSDGRKIQ